MNRERAWQRLGLALTAPAHRSDLWSRLSKEDWSELTRTAQREGVAPVLYYTQESAGWPLEIPEHLREELRADCLKAAGSNLLIYRELSRILSTLQAELPHISVVLLKGAALANTVYSSIALRPMTDIDLLLRREHLESAVEALRSIGYRDAAPEMTPGLSRKTHFQVALKGGPRGYVITELHWSLVGGEGDWRSPDLDWFWAETESWHMLEESGKSGTALSALQLRPTAHLLYLAAHLMLQHGGAQARLLWEYDIHLLLTPCERRLDWEELRRRAREFRWASALRAALARTHESFRTPLPEGFLRDLEEDEDHRSRSLVQRKEHPVQTRATATWSYLRTLNWRTRLQRALSALWPTPAYVRWRYRPRPEWLWPLCYPYRWLLFACDSAVTLARLAWRCLAPAR